MITLAAVFGILAVVCVLVLLATDDERAGKAAVMFVLAFLACLCGIE